MCNLKIPGRSFYSLSLSIEKVLQLIFVRAQGINKDKGKFYRIFLSANVAYQALRFDPYMAIR